jgi:primosomal protein N' (replication factor Y)
VTTQGSKIADLVVPVAVETAYSYRVPDHLDLQPGDIVEAPLGTRMTSAVVWSLREGNGANFKAIEAKRDLPALPVPLMRFIDRLARWTLSPRGMALRLALRASEHIEPPRPSLGYRATGVLPERATPTRARALAIAGEGFALSKSQLAAQAGVSVGVIDSLVDCGALEAVVLPPPPIAQTPDPDYAPPVLEEDQALAAQALVESVRARAFQTHLLEGVTGSGKTEVYFEAVAEALRQGGQALILMPEIALTAQFLDRFEQRFGARPAEWHSSVAQRKRGLIWEAVAKGEARVVVGARSALFLPFVNLRALIVDEEHEGAYKQEDGVSYNARDMAVLRAQLEGGTAVLASATPAIETRVNAQTGRYNWLRLGARAQGRVLPDIRLVDLKRAGPPRGQFISPPLRAELARNLEAGEQSLLFLNRRGYAPLTLCRSCGHRYQCPQCTSWLVEHRFRRALMCHQCGHLERKPEKCCECDAPDSLVACGPGVERLADEVKTLFPEARLMMMSSDFPGGTERLRREFDAFAKGEADILIGTQLVAKGHNFPLTTLVGIVDADLGLGGGDPRAAERTFQLLQQATGRAGRGAKPGRALVQSFAPDHPVIAALAAGDVEGFYAQEIAVRQAGRLPPFSRLAALIVSGADKNEAEAHARALARASEALREAYRLAPPGDLAGADEFVVMGPAEAPIFMVRGRYRYRLLIRAPRMADLQGFTRALLAAGPKARGSLRVAVDIEPMSFL